LRATRCFDDAASQIGVDQAATGAFDRFPQARIGNPFAARVPRQPFAFEDAHVQTLAR
jgi:hypothetical protein